MKKVKDFLIRYFTKDSRIEVSLFKILGLSGILVSIIAGIQSIVTGISVSGGLIDFGAALLSVLLLWFVDKTGKYVIGYIVTELGVFMALFGILFFEMGGLNGSMTYFFAFGLVFSFLMFRGVMLVIMESLQVGFYLFLCLYSYTNPSSVTPFASPKDQVIDQIMGIVLSGVGIGLIFLVYIQQYEKQRQLALEASKAKSRFLANMSHELRTPINMMLGINEMISRESSDDVIREYTRKADAAGKQLLMQVNQLLEFSKVDAGREKAKRTAYNLWSILDNLEGFYEKEASAKGLHFALAADRNIEGHMLGDSQKLTQILTNLLSNAVKYTKEGSIVLTVRQTEAKDNEQRLYFEVRDTGIGIREKEKSKIFEAFERADLDRNINIEGTGLGLSIAQTFAKAIGTLIEVESTYGTGSRFFFTLTQQLADDTGDAETLNRQQSFIAPNAKVLVVDDYSMNLEVAKALLKRTMVKVETALSGDECLDKLASEHFDLIILDYMMPVKDGVATLKELRGLKNGNVPVIVLTADVSEGKKEALLDEGFDAYLPKPVDSSELERLLMHFLPEELLIKTSGYTEVREAGEFVERMTAVLAAYDIDLTDGVRHFGNDLVQYVRLATTYVKGFEETSGELDSMRSEADYGKLIYRIHSLKGSAGNVGAHELRTVAVRLEERLRRDDREFFDAGRNFMQFELGRVIKGLQLLIEEYNGSEAKAVLEGSAADEAIPAAGGPADVRACLTEALDYLENSNQLPAIQRIDSAMAAASDDARPALTEIRKQITEIEFESAAEELRKLLSRL